MSGIRKHLYSFNKEVKSAKSIILIVAVVSWVYAYVQMHQNVEVTYV